MKISKRVIAVCSISFEMKITADFRELFLSMHM